MEGYGIITNRQQFGYKPKENLATQYFDYNDAYERVYEEFRQGTNVLSTKHLLAGGQYEVETQAGIETQRLYLDGSPYSASVVIEKTGSATAQPYYIHRDYLGSVTQISDKFGNLAAEYSYDAWGRMRNVTDWQVYAPGTEPELRFGRGYTGHEHLNKLGLINMNARLYDPVLGRFISPDPLVGSPFESNGYNRYMYASNNPLMYVDIDGQQDGYPGGNFGGGNQGGGGPYFPNTNMPGGNSSNGYYMGGGFNYNGGYGGYGGSYGGGYAYGGSGYGGLVFGFLHWLFNPKYGPSYYNVNATSSPSAYSFKPTIKLKNPVGVGISTVYSGGKKRQGGSNSSISPNIYKFPYQFFIGLNASVASEVFYSDFFQTWMGKDFKFRSIIGRKGNGNHYTGGKYKFGKRISNIFKWVGWGFTAYSVTDVTKQYVNDEINNYQFLSEQGSNGISIVPVYGTAWSLGWEGGRAITYTSLYQKLTFEFWYNQGVKRWGAPNELNHVLWDEWLEFRAKYYFRQF